MNYDELFKKEYFSFYEFLVEAEIQLRKTPAVHQVSTGFLYLGGKQPIYAVISAVPTKEDAISLLHREPIRQILDDLIEEVMGSSTPDGLIHQYDVVKIIKKRIQEIECEDYK